MSNKYTPKRTPKPLPDGTFEIILTKGYVAIIDAIDVDLAMYNWSIKHRGNSNMYYAFRGTKIGDEKQIDVGMHQSILSRMLGRELSRNEYVDHIDGNGLNNRRSNLRLATLSQNAQNRRIAMNNTCGYKGVTFHKQTRKYRAQISVRGKKIALGYYTTPEEAYKAYCEAANKYFGEFARYE